MIWEPFVLALFLGVIVSAGLYFAYLWPSVEPVEEPAALGGDAPVADPDTAATSAVAEPPDTSDPPAPASTPS